MTKRMKCFILICAICMIVVASIFTFMRITKSSDIDLFFLLLSQGKQFRSIVMVCVLFCYGWLIIGIFKGPQKDFFIKELLSFPIGLGLWGLNSVIILSLGIVYNLMSVSVISICEYFVLLGMHWKSVKISMHETGWAIFLFWSVAFLVSTGIFHSYMTGDSYGARTWGTLIARAGTLQEQYGYSLTSTGLLPATISSLSYFCGVGNVYVQHHCLMICFWGLVCYVIYQQLEIKQTNIKLFIAIVISLFIYLLPPIHFASGLVLAHTYQMVIVFLLVYALRRVAYKDDVNRLDRISIIFMVLLLAFLRVDAPILLCVILFCFAMCGFKDIFFLLRLAAYIMMAMLLYYLRIYLLCGELSGKFIDISIVGLMVAACIFVMICCIIIYRIGEEASTHYMEKIAYISLMLFNIGLLVICGSVYIDNFKVIIQNAIEPSQLWGATLGILLVLMWYAFRRKEKRDVLFMVSVFMLVVGVDLGVLRTFTGSIAARLGWGDSMNRTIWSYLPIVISMGLVRLCNDIDWVSILTARRNYEKNITDMKM